MTHPTDSGSDDVPKLYKPEEAAAKLRVTRYWLIANARAGKIPHTRLHHRAYRFSEEDIDEIAAMRAQPVTGDVSGRSA